MWSDRTCCVTGWLLVVLGCPSTAQRLCKSYSSLFRRHPDSLSRVALALGPALKWWSPTSLDQVVQQEVHLLRTAVQLLSGDSSLIEREEVAGNAVPFGPPVHESPPMWLALLLELCRLRWLPFSVLKRSSRSNDKGCSPKS